MQLTDRTQVSFPCSKELSQQRQLNGTHTPVLASTNQSLYLFSQNSHSLRLLEQIDTFPQKLAPAQIIGLPQNPQISRFSATSNKHTRTTRNKLPTKEIKLLQFSTSKFIFPVSKTLLMKSPLFSQLSN